MQRWLMWLLRPYIERITELERRLDEYDAVWPQMEADDGTT